MEGSFPYGGDGGRGWRGRLGCRELTMEGGEEPLTHGVSVHYGEELMGRTPCRL